MQAVNEESEAELLLAEPLLVAAALLLGELLELLELLDELLDGLPQAATTAATAKVAPTAAKGRR
jgi:hypothetical protein